MARTPDRLSGTSASRASASFGDFYERVVEDVFPKHAAHCEAHARQITDKVRTMLPRVKESVSRRLYRATA